MMHFNTFQYIEYGSSKKSERSTERSGFYADIEFLNENLFVPSEVSVRYHTFRGKFFKHFMQGKYLVHSCVVVATKV